MTQLIWPYSAHLFSLIVNHHLRLRFGRLYLVTTLRISHLIGSKLITSSIQIKYFTLLTSCTRGDVTNFNRVLLYFSHRLTFRLGKHGPPCWIYINWLGLSLKYPSLGRGDVEEKQISGDKSYGAVSALLSIFRKTQHWKNLQPTKPRI